MKTLRQSSQKRKSLQIPITDFTYDPATRKFYRYGQEWKAAGVDACVERVLHEGKLIKPTQWLKRYAQ
jgi:hypothetical protein